MKYIIVLSLLFTSKLTKAQNFLSQYLTANQPARLDTIISLHSKDSHAVDIPITVIRGTQKGPTFTIIAGIHGMEYPTIVSLLELSRELNPAKLKGNVVILPVVNQPSFFKRVPFVNPMDEKNLNRVFPGSKEGSITEVMANFITTQLYPHTDILLDMHGGDVSEDLLPFICYYDNKEFKEQTATAAKLSEVSGFENIVVYPYSLTVDQPAKYAFKQAVRQGVTALSIEIGKLGQMENADVKTTKDAIFRMLAELNMYETTFSLVNMQRKYFSKQMYIPVPAKGIFYSSVKAGDPVEKGQVLGYVKDVFGQELSKVTSNVSGIVLYKVGTPPVNMGESLFCIGSQ